MEVTKKSQNVLLAAAAERLDPSHRQLCIWQLATVFSQRAQCPTMAIETKSLADLWSALEGLRLEWEAQKAQNHTLVTELANTRFEVERERKARRVLEVGTAVARVDMGRDQTEEIPCGGGSINRAWPLMDLPLDPSRSPRGRGRGTELSWPAPRAQVNRASVSKEGLVWEVGARGLTDAMPPSSPHPLATSTGIDPLQQLSARTPKVAAPPGYGNTTAATRVGHLQRLGTRPSGDVVSPRDTPLWARADTGVRQGYFG